MPRIQVWGKVNAQKACQTMPELLAESLKEPLGKLAAISIFDDNLVDGFGELGGEMLEKVNEALSFCDEVIIRMGNACIDVLPQPEQPTNPVLARPISSMGLLVRAKKCMNYFGIITIGQLVEKTADELREKKHFGSTSLSEVREKLRDLGLKLKDD